MERGMESTGGPIRGALARLRSAPLWVWITILLTFGLLIFAYLQYKKSQSSGATGSATDTSGSSAGLGTVPADGSGQPLWNTADTSGFVAGNVTDLANLLAYLKSQNTPNAPTTATPTPAGSTSIPQAPGAPTSSPNGSALVTTSNGTFFHITQRYSAASAGTTTLSGLAHRYNTTVANLLKLNPQVNPSTKITYQGEWVRIQ